MHTIGQFISGGRPLALSQESWRRHLYAIGSTGTGKSTLLFNLAREDLENDRAFALIDPHGDLSQAIADAAPLRRNDILYFDPSDLSHPTGFNILESVPKDMRALVAAQVTAAFKAIWADSWGPRLEYILTNAVRLLLDGRATTLLGLPRLLTDHSYRHTLLDRCTDPVVKAFWRNEFESWSERFRQEAVAPLQNKIGALLSPPAIRNIIGQAQSTLDIPHLMNSGKVLIVNLSKGKLGEAPSHLLGALLVSAFAQAAEARAGIAENDRRDFTLYVDEFQNFATESFATILSEARKWRLSLVLAHQILGQVPPSLRQAVLGNAGTIVSFRIGAEDAPLIAGELGLRNPAVLTETPNFQAWVKLIDGGVPTEPRIMQTLPPGLTRGRLEAVRARTRARHTRPRAKVENTIRMFLERA